MYHEIIVYIDSLYQVWEVEGALRQEIFFYAIGSHVL